MLNAITFDSCDWWHPCSDKFCSASRPTFDAKSLSSQGYHDFPYSIKTPPLSVVPQTVLLSANSDRENPTTPPKMAGDARDAPINTAAIFLLHCSVSTRAATFNPSCYIFSVRPQLWRSPHFPPTMSKTPRLQAPEAFQLTRLIQLSGQSTRVSTKPDSCHRGSFE